MARQKGTRKTGGRKKGTPNKKSQILSEILDNNNFSAPEKLICLLPQLHVDKQADVLLTLMSYIYPKRKAIEIKEAEEVDRKPFEIVFIKPKLDK